MPAESSLPLYRVMVVDDDDTNLLLAAEVLRLFGVEPIPRNNATAAFEAVEQDPVDMIFMDVYMPGTCGLELTERIRALEQQLGRRRTPIIALTAGCMPDQQAACMARGMDGVLSKPFGFALLRATLDRWCQPR